MFCAVCVCIILRYDTAMCRGGWTKKNTMMKDAHTLTQIVLSLFSVHCKIIWRIIIRLAVTGPFRCIEGKYKGPGHKVYSKIYSLGIYQIFMNSLCLLKPVCSSY